MTGIKHFHAHLDVCPQCANNPFHLCPEGLQRLHEAAKIENPALQIMAQANDPIADVRALDPAPALDTHPATLRQTGTPTPACAETEVLQEEDGDHNSPCLSDAQRNPTLR